MSRNQQDDGTLDRKWAMSGDKKQSFYAFFDLMQNYILCDVYDGLAPTQDGEMPEYEMRSQFLF
ncbi:MAG: hypothetical protein V7K48_20580 [Nostoc sp.]|uniref:hypothetical protein n=1 Tax=Nostoc sp. TaxID=1180 RepID=UPI002FF4D6F7